MTESLTRFELAFDGEPQGVGFLQGLTDVGLPGVNIELLYALFASLPCPNVKNDNGVEFWFRPDGIDKYRDAINAVIQALDTVNWQVLCGTMEEDVAANSIYSDSWQAGFSPEYLETDHASFTEISQV